MLSPDRQALVTKALQQNPGSHLESAGIASKTLCEPPCHAVASFGCLYARWISQAPIATIGSESSMPIVM